MQFTRLSFGLQTRKETNWQLGCHCWTVDNFYVCTKMILPKLKKNVPPSYPSSRTSKFYEWLRIKCDKCNKVVRVIALEFVLLITLWSTNLYALQELIKLLHVFVNYICSSVRNRRGIWYSAMVKSPNLSDEVAYEKDVTWSSWLWTWWSCHGQVLIGFMNSKSSHVRFFTSLPIQST